MSHERLGRPERLYFQHSGKPLEDLGQALHHPACILNAIFWLLCGKQVEEGGRG